VNSEANYRNTYRIDYLGDFPGARRETDRVAVQLEESIALEVADNIDRLLGRIAPAAGEVWTVQESDPLDVSANPVPIDDPIDVSASPLEVGTWSAGALDASAAPIEVGTWSAGSLTVDQSSAVDVSDRAGRDLGTVSTPDQPGYDDAEIDGATLAADGSVTRTIQAEGATELVGTASSTGQYDVSVEWQTTGGTTLRTDSIVTDEAGDTPTSLNVAAGGAVAVVTITDKSSAEQTAKGGVTLA